MQINPLITTLVLIAAAAGAAPAPKRPAPAKAAPAVPTKAAKPMAFTPAGLDLAPGETYPVALYVPSPNGKYFQGTLGYAPPPGITVKADERWTGKLPPWGAKTYPKIIAAQDAAGELTVRAALEKGGTAALTVRVAAPVVELVPGERKLTVKVTNPFRSRPMSGRILASNPDRFLQDVTSREFKAPPGEPVEVVFPLPGAAPVETETYEFTLEVRTYAGYRDRKTYPVKFPPQEEKIPILKP